jgi:hypothetical protein
LRDGDGVSISVFKGEFLHAVELAGNRHGDFRPRLLDAIEDGLQVVDFRVESRASANAGGEAGEFGGNGLPIVEKDFDNAVRD